VTKKTTWPEAETLLDEILRTLADLVYFQYSPSFL